MLTAGRDRYFDFYRKNSKSYRIQYVPWQFSLPLSIYVFLVCVWGWWVVGGGGVREGGGGSWGLGWGVFYYPSVNQYLADFFSVMLWVYYKVITACSSVSCVKYDNVDIEWSFGLIVCCACPVDIIIFFMFDGMTAMVWWREDESELTFDVMIVFFVRMFLCPLMFVAYNMHLTSFSCYQLLFCPATLSGNVDSAVELVLHTVTPDPEQLWSFHRQSNPTNNLSLVWLLHCVSLASSTDLHTGVRSKVESRFPFKAG